MQHSMMQEIEQAAQGVIVGYEAQVEQIRTGFTRSPCNSGTALRWGNQALVTEAEKRLERLARLTKDQEETVVNAC